jgi:hypothetical protein
VSKTDHEADTAVTDAEQRALMFVSSALGTVALVATPLALAAPAGAVDREFRCGCGDPHLRRRPGRGQPFGSHHGALAGIRAKGEVTRPKRSTSSACHER